MANSPPDAAAYLDDLLEEWRLTAEAGWNRPLSAEETRIVLAELERREMQEIEGERPAARDRLYVNEERTVFVRVWADGTVEVARRDDPSHTWGPPVYLKEERPA